MEGNKQIIDVKTWKRREHFEFFSKFDEPFFGVTTELDCTQAYLKCKTEGLSFYHYYLYQSLKAANQTEQMRYRIDGDQVVCFDTIHASATELRSDETFAFTFLSYHDKFSEFSEEVKKEAHDVEQSTGLRLGPKTDRIDLIHYSSIPWIRYTSVSHARSFSRADSVPKISFGRFRETDGTKWLPMSVHCHHALMDGLHLSRYFEQLQELLLSN